MFFHVFAQTTHVVAAPHGFACVVNTRGPVIYSKFHRNPFRGFGAPGGQNLAFPITLASRFYNSLYYRASCDIVISRKRCHIETLLLQTTNRKWYTVYRMVVIPVTSVIHLFQTWNSSYSFALVDKFLNDGASRGPSAIAELLVRLGSGDDWGLYRSSEEWSRHRRRLCRDTDQSGRQKKRLDRSKRSQNVYGLGHCFCLFFDSRLIRGVLAKSIEFKANRP